MTNIETFLTGDPVQVRDLRTAPLAGYSGKIAAVTSADPYGPYLVEFRNGLRFRYRKGELIALTSYFDSASKLAESRPL